MISYRNAPSSPAFAAGAIEAPPLAPTTAPDPLHGPARHRDPLQAMAADVAEIFGSRGCVEEVDLRQRGWRTAEILEYLPGAIELAQGRADRVPA